MLHYRASKYIPWDSLRSNQPRALHDSAFVDPHYCSRSIPSGGIALGPRELADNMDSHNHFQRVIPFHCIDQYHEIVGHLSKIPLAGHTVPPYRLWSLIYTYTSTFSRLLHVATFLCNLLTIISRIIVNVKSCTIYRFLIFIYIGAYDESKSAYASWM